MFCGTKLQLSSTSAGNWISLVMEIEVEPLAGALGVMSTMKINGRCERKTWNNGCLDEQPGLSFDAPLVHHFQSGFSKPWFFSTSSNRPEFFVRYSTWRVATTSPGASFCWAVGLGLLARRKRDFGAKIVEETVGSIWRIFSVGAWRILPLNSSLVLIYHVLVTSCCCLENLPVSLKNITYSWLEFHLMKNVIQPEGQPATLLRPGPGDF